MRRFIVQPVALFAALAIGAWAGGAAPQSATKSSTTKKKKSTGSAKATTAASKSKRAPVAVHRAPQQPSVERYKEIQQALASRGYFHGEPDGNWGPASVEGLKRFQHDQNLVEDGKIGSLSLIALGLGPKREAPAETEQKTP